MRDFRSLQVLVLFALVGTSAGAGNTGQAADPTFDWVRSYVGVQAGHLSSDFAIDYSSPSATTWSSPDADGFVGGIYGGFNWRGANNLIFGIEGEYNWVNADGSDEEKNTAGPVANYYYSTEINSTAALRLRLAHAMERTLIYAAGGLAYIDYDANYYWTGTQDLSDDSWGWTIGVGVEHAFTDRIVGRVEYRYSDYGKASTPEALGFGGKYKTELTTNEIRVGLAVLF